MTEQKIQEKIMKWLKTKGAICNKTIGMSKAGWPDLLCCFKGRFIGLEVKKPGQRATKLQEFKLAELKAAGAYVGVVTSVSETEILFDGWD